MEEPTSAPWSCSGWRESVSAWIFAHLKARGISASGDLDQPHVRPWSTVLRVPTSDGPLWFKATSRALGHEPALTEALARWRPDCMPELLAADVDRGWLLMRDGGEPLRGIVRADRDLGHWQRVLAVYAELQIALADRADDMLSLGALDHRLATLADRIEVLLEDPDGLLLGEPEGFSFEETDQLRALVPAIRRDCTELASLGIPETLWHDDFHDANILVRDGRYTFFDWGEAGVAHPFFTMNVTLRSIAWSLELDPDGPELADLRDTYLEPWARFASRSDVLRAFPTALLLGNLSRTLTWHHIVSSLDGPNRAAHADAVPHSLRRLLASREHIG